MGNNSSNKYTAKQEEAIMAAARERALKIYNYRVNSYNYLVHGPIEYYMVQIQAEYELECIPEFMRSGRAFQ
jgi:hypothetical protein